jgi:hypothetical protein
MDMTFCPTLNLFTSDPISSTIPTNSWPYLLHIRYIEYQEGIEGILARMYHDMPGGCLLVTAIHMQVAATYPRNLNLQNCIAFIEDDRFWVLFDTDVKWAFVYYCLHDCGFIDIH